MHTVMIISFFSYLVLLICIAYAALSQQYVEEEGESFMLGGRSLGYIVTALSAHAADMSDWLFMGLPGAVYVYGFTKAWVAVALIIGMYLSWHFIAGPLRIATEQYRSYTLSSYFQRRFADTTGLINIASACIVVFFFTIYLAVGVKGTGYILDTIFGIPYVVGAFIGALIVILYSALGGYIAVAWVDAFQAIFLLMAIVVTPLYAYIKLPNGLYDIVMAVAQREAASLSYPTWSAYGMLQVLMGPMGWALGYFGMPHILSKFMGARNPADMHKSKYIGIVWQIIALSAAIAVAVVGVAYFPQGLNKPELIFVAMTTSLFTPFIAGLIFCGFLAATFSTMDSQVLVLAGLMTDDIYKNFVNPYATQRELLFIYRLSIVIASLIAFFIAYDESRSTIFGLVEYAWSGIGASFGPLVILSLYSTRVNKYGAVVGIITGGLIAALWRWIDWMPYGIMVNAIIPGFIGSTCMILVVSWVTARYAIRLAE